MEFPRVSIVVLNWNGLEDTVKCLESLKKLTCSNYEIVVVDNGSRGEDASTLESNYRGYITLLRNAENAGFAGGNNLAIKWLLENTNPDYLLLLNNDTEVHPQFLTEMVSLAGSDPSVGMVGPKTYVLGSTSILQTVWAEMNMHTGQSILVGSLVSDRGQFDKEREVEYLQGSCLLIKRKVIEEVGLLDEAYFCYGEENDYCFRTRKAGFKIFYAPKAIIWHKNIVTVGLKPWYKTILSQDRDALPASKTYYMTRNIFRFMKKHATGPQYFSFSLYFFCYWFWYRSGVVLIYYRQAGVFRVFLKGVIDGLLGKAGKVKSQKY